MLHAAGSALRRVMSQSRVAIGDITFGMEDGAVSVSGLVFGVAASTSDANLVVLAGATGAAAGAVSMMAGRYLDVQSVGHSGQALLSATRQHIARTPQPYLDRATHRLRAAGLTPDEADTVVEIFERNPDALLHHVAAYEIGLAAQPQGSPLFHALWMFVADLVAAGVPVIPFVFLPIQTAVAVTLVVTGLWMALLGIARGRIGGVNIWRSAVQTMAIAGAAALAGVLMGQLVTTQ
ncbi:MAG TPA: VIT1/CCC1 transporter family protein [Cellulomonadaceae bacterium]|nr:VIT1/CCC1 transporter family protein [Cellulomonadaceae bacterium]